MFPNPGIFCVAPSKRYDWVYFMTVMCRMLPQVLALRDAADRQHRPALWPAVDTQARVFRVTDRAIRSSRRGPGPQILLPQRFILADYLRLP